MKPYRPAYEDGLLYRDSYRVAVEVGRFDTNVVRTTFLLNRACVGCGAEAGTWCMTPSGRVSPTLHNDRAKGVYITEGGTLVDKGVRS